MERLASMDVRRLRLPGGEEPAAFVAEGFRERLLGLAGVAEPPAGTALLIPRCRAVHTFGMRFRLDVLFVTLDEDRLVVHDARQDVPPCRFVRASPTARAQAGLAALEMVTTVTRSLLRWER
jgi:uncharacterized protein